MNGLTNATSQDTAWCPKHQIVKSVLSVRRHYPKRGRFTENLSIYLSSPAPNSPLQNPSNFGATASHWLLYILLFFFFLILTGWMRGALCVAMRLYILYLAADESISGWEFLLLIPKSPQVYGPLRSILLDQGILVKKKKKKKIRWYTLTTSYLLSFLWDQRKPLYFMLSLKPWYKT